MGHTYPRQLNLLNMSAKILFISDLHLGHYNMAIRRGFENAEEMNQHIIKSWNSVVNKKDTVYILGDITMEKAADYPLLNQLLGFKKVVLGNHDKAQHIPQLLKYVNSVAGMVKFGSPYGNIFLTHCPIHPSELEFGVKYNIHGHVHENTIDDIRYKNVSCENIDYKPKSLEELLG